MEFFVRQFAKRVVLLHLLLLGVLLALVSLAMVEVYGRSRDQAVRQTRERQGLLASQTASGVEQYYRSIFAALNTMKRAEEDEALRGFRPEKMPQLAPGMAQRLADRRPPLMFARPLWKQLEGRVSYLFAITTEDKVVARFFPEEPRNRAGQRPQGPPAEQGGTPRPEPTIDPARQQQLAELQAIVDQSRDWLKTVTKSTIGPFIQTPAGEANLIVIPDVGGFMAGAVVPVQTIQTEFLDSLNARPGVAAWLVDDQSNVIAARGAGTNDDPATPRLSAAQMKAMAAQAIDADAQSTDGRVIDHETTVDGARLYPSILNAKPFEVGARRWWVVVASPLDDTDAVVNATFRRALVLAIFVVFSVTAILVSTAVQMIRQRVKIERMRHEARAKEIRDAREIQLAWLPKQAYQPPGVSIAAVNQPASDLSGDFYNWFELPDGRVAVAIGDVTGHGMAATFLMATTQLLVRTTLQRVGDPGRCLEEVNRQLASQTYSGQFVTMLLMVIDPARRALEIASAGHYPPLTRTAGGTFEALPVDSQLVLGLDPSEPYPTHRLRLSGDAALVLYTDGALDSQAPDGKRFGLAGLLRELPAGRESCQHVVDTVLSAINGFRQSRSPVDDVTLVAVQLATPHPAAAAAGGLRATKAGAYTA